MQQDVASWWTITHPRPAARVRLFCFAGAGAGGSTYRAWGESIGPAIEVRAVELPGHWKRHGEPLAESMPALVEKICTAMLFHVSQPFALFGFSMGATLAFEVARWLQKHHRIEAQHLFLAGRFAPHTPPPFLKPLHQLPDDVLISTMADQFGLPENMQGTPDLVATVVPLMRADLRLIETHPIDDMTPVACPMTVIVGAQDASTAPDCVAGWQALCAQPVKFTQVSGAHHFMEAQSHHLATMVRDTLLSDGSVTSPENRLGGALAVVGLACRMPKAADANAFWELLQRGDSAVLPIPRGRWDTCGSAEDDGALPTHGGLLTSVDDFDAAAFHISPREARAMDPQQRLLLTLAWQAIESAGLPTRITGERVGVYIGASESGGYGDLKGPHDASRYDNTGEGLCAMVARLAYAFGATGPVFGTDGNETSALQALHLASRDLRAGACDWALVGSVSLLLSSVTPRLWARRRLLSRGCVSRPFDADADGCILGEGAGVLVLKRLADAERAGDRILAVVRGSAVTYGNGHDEFFVPSERGAEQSLRAALSDADAAPEAVEWVECTANGIPAADRAWGEAAAQVFGASNTTPVVLGAVAGNVGHLRQAAGMAGLCKAILAIAHGALPGTPGASPHSSLPLPVPTQTRPWPSPTRTACVTASSLVGMHASAILCAHRPGTTGVLSPVAANGAVPRTHHVLTLSAPDEAGLARLARCYADHLAKPGVSFADFCYTVNTTRAKLEHRAAVVASDAHQARALLLAVAKGERPEGVAYHRLDLARLSPKVQAPTLAESVPHATLLELAQAFVHGTPVDWQAFDAPFGRLRVPVPGYPFAVQRYWLNRAT